MVYQSLFAALIFAMSLHGFAESKVPQEEVDALQQITSTMGARYWKFDSESCQVEMVGLTPEQPNGAESSIGCECNYENNTICHVVMIIFKGYSLPGTLPLQLINLPYIKKIDFAYNYLSGTIPKEWGSLKLTFISLLVNRLSGEIPKELGNISTLQYLNLEANQFSESIPPELGDLANLGTLILSSNRLKGNLPMTLAGLQNLTSFRINDNNFSGSIPNFIQNWSILTRLEMHASGLEGPIPSNISLLVNLVQLRISDIRGTSQNFPFLKNMLSLQNLVLRNCNLSGELPAYIWSMRTLEMLDVSFNNLVGEIPGTIPAERLRFIFLTGNMLRGDVPDSIFKDGSSVDLSYNNFTWQGPGKSACRDSMNLNLNLFRSSSGENQMKSILPCQENFQCPRYASCLHVNCGGNDISVQENGQNIPYMGDGKVQGGTATYFHDDDNQWGFSSTGDFMDDNDFQNTRYTISLLSANMPALYSTARIAPISLTYFHYCLENGNYTINLHFAEIQFTNDKTYRSLGRRLFDIYVQDRLVHKDFNIEDETEIAQKPLVIPVHNVSVTKNIMEIRLHWAGKGTTRIPDSGVYGPLISAFSLVSNTGHCSYKEDKKRILPVVFGVLSAVLFLLLTMVAISWWKGCFKGKLRKQEVEQLDVQTRTFSLKQIKAATNDFDHVNKIGEGGFGPVYKGQLPDGTVIAVKQLSSMSRQGNREFLNEIGMISCLQHPNLVKLHGCCIEGEQLMLVYEYMENNSLARVLFGRDNSQIQLDWNTRFKICVGIARGLAFLHEESTLKIVHRDIKATNVLLDRNLNPKISDFGLAKLGETDKTHISTKIAGTIGYMAPEYALWGHLTFKADVYSFGVVTLEIVSGRNNNNYIPSDDSVCLLDHACHLQQLGNLMKLVDEKSGLEVNQAEAEVVLKVALLCTNASPLLRPTMSEVVKMLEGQMPIPDIILEPGSYKEDLRFKSMRDLYRQEHSSSGSQNQQTMKCSLNTSSSSGYDEREINPESSQM